MRELHNVVERAALLADGSIKPEHLPDEVTRPTGAATDELSPPHPVEAESVLAEDDRDLILKALEQTNWNQSAAARELGISRDILR